MQTRLKNKKRRYYNKLDKSSSICDCYNVVAAANEYISQIEQHGFISLGTGYV